MRTRRYSMPAWLAVLAAVAAVALTVAVPASVAGATSSPAASLEPSEPPPERPEIQAWLDRLPPTDAQPGSTIDIGVTLWDPAGPEIPRMGATIFVEAVPPTGSGDRVRAVAIRDWPGHYEALVKAPDGGLEDVRVGVPGTLCENEVCRPDDWLFNVMGAGPPPDAPVTSLAAARVDLGGSSITAGTPIDVSVLVQPNADWAAFLMPTEIVFRAHEARGPNVATASLPLADAAAGTYTGELAIPVAGELVVEAATDEDGGDATRFGTSMVRVTVAPASGGSPTSPDEVVAEEGLPPVVVLLLAVVAVILAGVVLAGFRSGGR
jgi:hypothetical protein